MRFKTSTHTFYIELVFTRLFLDGTTTHRYYATPDKDCWDWDTDAITAAYFDHEDGHASGIGDGIVQLRMGKYADLPPNSCPGA
jgi:hypothetical protein